MALVVISSASHGGSASGREAPLSQGHERGKKRGGRGRGRGACGEKAQQGEKKRERHGRKSARAWRSAMWSFTVRVFLPTGSLLLRARKQTSKLFGSFENKVWDRACAPLSFVVCVMDHVCALFSTLTGFAKATRWGRKKAESQRGEGKREGPSSAACRRRAQVRHSPAPETMAVRVGRVVGCALARKGAHCRGCPRLWAVCHPGGRWGRGREESGERRGQR